MRRRWSYGLLWSLYCPLTLHPRVPGIYVASPAGLLACGSLLLPRLPGIASSGTWGGANRTQLRGQPRPRTSPSLPHSLFRFLSKTDDRTTINEVARAANPFCPPNSSRPHFGPFRSGRVDIALRQRVISPPSTVPSRQREGRRGNAVRNPGFQSAAVPATVSDEPRPNATGGCLREGGRRR